jgi:uncharacterized membrane protein YqiK
MFASYQSRVRCRRGVFDDTVAIVNSIRVTLKTCRHIPLAAHHTHQQDIMAYLAAYGVPLLIIAAVILFILSGSIRYIPNNRAAIVERLWSEKGSVKSGFIALEDEAGYQPDILRGGFHFFKPFTYRVHKVPLVSIGQNSLGYVFSRDGLALEPGQTLASNANIQSFDDVRTFLANGGQKGPQRRVLREGTYALNLAMFAILTKEDVFALNLDSSETKFFEKMKSVIEERGGFEPVVIKGADDVIGVVTVHDGPGLPEGEIIAPTVDNVHNGFQDAEAFLRVGGYKGRQYQTLAEGSWPINRLFATVELIPKKVIEVGNVGVVTSYTGKRGVDQSGADYNHGELVEEGFRGVWSKPLLPGKYAFNTFAGNVQAIPTTNFLLAWKKGVTSDLGYDDRLAEIQLITKDAFEPLLPLSVVVHIDYRKAPEVVQRFGDIKKLVEQTLDPMISAFFKSSAQSKTLIELIQNRSEIQEQALQDLKLKFAAYSLELQEVLIGTPRSREGDKQIEELLTQLRERQLAVEKVDTYKLKEKAAVQERTLREAQAKAEQQSGITASQLSIEIRTNEGRAAKAFAEQQAEVVTIEAAAEAQRRRLEGEGEAASIKAKGIATAEAARAQVDAYGGPEFRLNEILGTQFANAIREGKLDIVPRIQVQGGSGAEGASNPLQQLLSAFLANRLGDAIDSKDDAVARRGATEAMTGALPAPVAPANGNASTTVGAG